MKITNLVGYFDCRQYKKDVQKSARPMVEKGGRISFTAIIDEMVGMEEVEKFIKKSDKNDRYYLTIKIFPKTCKVFTHEAKQIDFPDYGKIDGGRFEINVDVAVKHGTGTELNGVYANAIQIIRRADVPFEAVSGDTSFLDSEVDNVEESKLNDGLPF